MANIPPPECMHGPDIAPFTIECDGAAEVPWLRRTFGPRTFRFRARVRRENGYPYELGYSRRVKVRVS